MKNKTKQPITHLLCVKRQARQSNSCPNPKASVNPPPLLWSSCWLLCKQETHRAGRVKEGRNPAGGGGGGQLLTSAEAELEEDGMRGTGGETARALAYAPPRRQGDLL